MFRVLLLAVVSLGSTDGAKWINGTCPKWQTLSRYVPDGGLLYKYMYQHRSLNNYLFEEGGRCGKLYSAAEHGILMSTLEQKSKDGKTESGLAFAEVASDKNYPTSHIFNIKFMRNGALAPLSIATMLVATDQKNYGVLYSCRSILDRSLDLQTNPRKMEIVLVFTAKPGDTSFDEKIKKKLAAIGLDYDSFEVTDQTNC